MHTAVLPLLLPLLLLRLPLLCAVLTAASLVVSTQVLPRCARKMRSQCWLLPLALSAAVHARPCSIWELCNCMSIWHGIACSRARCSPTRLVPGRGARSLPACPPCSAPAHTPAAMLTSLMPCSAQAGNTAAFNATQRQIKAWISEWVLRPKQHWKSDS